MELIEFRHLLHRNPDISGMEDFTSTAILNRITGYKPDRLVTNLGGKGIAAEFTGSDMGPRILLRCDMDALPINETMDIPHRSVTTGVSHKCGHDGHMAIMMGVAARLHKTPPAKGSVVLLFQPSEETGDGARKVIADSKFKDIEPDIVFAMHNLPGFPMGSIIMKNGVFASASSGIVVELTGVSAHASEPHLGNSPALAVAQIIEAFNDISRSKVPMDKTAMATVIHARVGEKAFGTSPGKGCVMATLRACSIEAMNFISRRAEETAETIAKAHKLDCRISWTQDFPVTINSGKAVNTVRAAAENLGLEILQPDAPFPWSEDFGHFTQTYPGTLFGIGAGIDAPPLHNPLYDFPDELIPGGVDIFIGIIKELLN